MGRADLTPPQGGRSARGGLGSRTMSSAGCDARGAVQVQIWRKDSPVKKLRHDVARRDHYEELTNTIIAKLEEGVLPWRRPWDPRICAENMSPMNPVTGRT